MKSPSWHLRARLLCPERTSRDGYYPKGASFRRSFQDSFAVLLPSPLLFIYHVLRKSHFIDLLLPLRPGRSPTGLIEFQPDVSQLLENYRFWRENGLANISRRRVEVLFQEKQRAFHLSISTSRRAE
jgi:hypothetical protein